MRVAEIVKAKGTAVHTAERDTSLRDAARLMRSYDVGSLVVPGNEGTAAGVLSERDIVAAFAAHGADATELPVSSVMRTGTPTCALTDTIETVMAEMTLQRARHLPVLDGGALVALLSIGDVVKGRLAELEQEARVVGEYVTWGR